MFSIFWKPQFSISGKFYFCKQIFFIIFLVDIFGSSRVCLPFVLRWKRLLTLCFSTKEATKENREGKNDKYYLNIGFCPKKFIRTDTMVYCFAPSCSHSSESHSCKFFAFPSDKKEKDEYKRLIRLIRFVMALIFIFLLKEHHKIWQFLANVRFPPSRNTEVILTNVWWTVAGSV